MGEHQVQQTRYLSEDVWRRSLAMQFENLRRVRGRSAKEVQQIHRRIARIRAGGLPEWRARYDAALRERDQGPASTPPKGDPGQGPDHRP